MFACRTGVDRHFDILADQQAVFRGRTGRDRPFKVFIDEKVFPDVVGHVVARIIHTAVAVDVLRDRPVLHLVPFTVRVIFRIVVELDLVVRRQQQGKVAVRTRLDGLGLDRVVRRNDTAVAHFEADTVHTQFVVYEGIVFVFGIVSFHPLTVDGDVDRLKKRHAKRRVLVVLFDRSRSDA